jgi:hypothetical protein
MKRYLLLISLALIAQSFRLEDCNNIPELNKQIVEFVSKSMNKKVGRGECWDLAAAALNSTSADWDKKYGYGKKVDPEKDCIFPGDLIQFEGVKIRYQEGKTIFQEELSHHTAIVYEVKEKGNYVLAEQNTSAHGRKVSIGKIALKNIVKGKYQFYRPVPGS